ncbi:MAG TPA: hypothetical protein VNZ53_32240 [Steroidobacteraceae bacterium]|jgi:hypothetical protein|nr:hypothetical protein [Steroidobacteraceae bacterium]
MEDRFLKRLRKKARKGLRGWPIATIAFYGPHLSQATKVTVGIVPSENAEVEELARLEKLIVVIFAAIPASPGSRLVTGDGPSAASMIPHFKRRHFFYARPGNGLRNLTWNGPRWAWGGRPCARATRPGRPNGELPKGAHST